MAKILSFPEDKIFRAVEERGTKVIQHKITGVIHRLDKLNDDYLYCGHLLFPNEDNFERFVGSDDEITCKKCLSNGPALPGWWRGF